MPVRFRAPVSAAAAGPLDGTTTPTATTPFVTDRIVAPSYEAAPTRSTVKAFASLMYSAVTGLVGEWGADTRVRRRTRALADGEPDHRDLDSWWGSVWTA